MAASRPPPDAVCFCGSVDALDAKRDCACRKGEFAYGHANCIEKACGKDGNCTICREPVEYVLIKDLMEKIVNDAWEYKKCLACKQTVTDLDAHVEDCPLVLITCECGTGLFRGKLADHLSTHAAHFCADCALSGINTNGYGVHSTNHASVCDYKLVTCDLCPAGYGKIPRWDLGNHEALDHTCNDCDALFKDLDDHQDAGCPFAPVPCAKGCGELVSPRTIEAHLAGETHRCTYCNETAVDHATHANKCYDWATRREVQRLAGRGMWMYSNGTDTGPVRTDDSRNWLTMATVHATSRAVELTDGEASDNIVRRKITHHGTLALLKMVASGGRNDADYPISMLTQPHDQRMGTALAAIAAGMKKEYAEIVSSADKTLSINLKTLVLEDHAAEGDGDEAMHNASHSADIAYLGTTYRVTLLVYADHFEFSICIPRFGATQAMSSHARQVDLTFTAAGFVGRFKHSVTFFGWQKVFGVFDSGAEMARMKRCVDLATDVNIEIMSAPVLSPEQID
jgi:hypothetical protein